MSGVTELVERAMGGDGEAFAALIESHRGWALAYAVNMLGEHRLAEEALQEAFLAAHAQLPTLAKPDAFPAWLRTIVHHKCYRYLRKRQPEPVSLEQALEVPDLGPGPELRAEEMEQRTAVLSALDTLPAEQRDTVLLYYWYEYSHREIAARLGIPATTVNNRLHSARRRLREELASTVVERGIAEVQMTASDQTGRSAGTIVKVQGPIVDVRFSPTRDLPPLRSWLVEAEGQDRGGPPLAASSYLGDGVVRAVACAEGGRWRKGQSVVVAGESVAEPVGDETADRMLSLLAQEQRQSRSRVRQPQLIETGIKAIDLLAPLAEGDVVGLSGASGTGQLVLVQELLYRLATRGRQLTLLLPIAAVSQDSAPPELPYGIGGLRTAYLPVRDPGSPPVGGTSQLAASIILSVDLARLGMYPAVDPAASRSESLDSGLVGGRHVEVARRVREALARLATSAERDNRAGDDGDPVPGRARRLRRFLTQPFFTAEPWIPRRGQFVPLAATIDGCAAILDGQHDDAPEEAFYMIGEIEEVRGESRRASPDRA